MAGASGQEAAHHRQGPLQPHQRLFPGGRAEERDAQRPLSPQRPAGLSSLGGHGLFRRAGGAPEDGAGQPGLSRLRQGGGRGGGPGGRGGAGRAHPPCPGHGAPAGERGRDGGPLRRPAGGLRRSHPLHRRPQLSRDRLHRGRVRHGPGRGTPGGAPVALPGAPHLPGWGLPGDAGPQPPQRDPDPAQRRRKEAVERAGGDAVCPFRHHGAPGALRLRPHGAGGEVYRGDRPEARSHGGKAGRQAGAPVRGERQPGFPQQPGQPTAPQPDPGGGATQRHPPGDQGPRYHPPPAAAAPGGAEAFHPGDRRHAAHRGSGRHPGRGERPGGGPQDHGIPAGAGAFLRGRDPGPGRLHRRLQPADRLVHGPGGGAGRGGICEKPSVRGADTKGAGKHEEHPGGHRRPRRGGNAWPGNAA